MSAQNPPAREAGDLADAVIVALGANDKGQFETCQSALDQALQHLEGHGCWILARSDWWESAAWPNPEDPPFINGVVIVGTDLGPKALMGVLSRIEDDLGRVRSVRNAPRTLDLDLIAYGRIAGDLDGLILPHPRAGERLFVMGPLAQIAPLWRHPVLDATAQELASTASVGRDARPVKKDRHG
ncbi:MULTISPECIES: 2-amino-4-hydroxy-6-hydroxymethyldihydropteridine diphosphokinase [unclassified Brevundimonas]|uniref:2-amino-4-hydroxy-6- hydroxymethyldihydropteridine diphosphokinase n=1 Tax=unclassified Brevundimonas TaxID=2622653 RepID=UPI0025C4D3D9|nr:MULTISPECIES: 2-amino-4-hydroxy-6-hydroxymethyldihydropteridine diphosphokinase [unclassified Brevundimonas]